MFFSIQRLSEDMPALPKDPMDPLTGIWVVGGNLYWACYDEQRRPRIEKDMEGYMLFFTKSLLLGDKRDFYGSFLASFCPLPGKGEIVQVEEEFLREGKSICELMLQEYENGGVAKAQALAELLRLFLLLLIRSSNGFMYVPSWKPESRTRRRARAQTDM